MHLFESSMVTTVDGLHCQVYSNQHPDSKILVKPKYIPTDKISSDFLPYRFIGGRKMNRLNLWVNKEKLGEYLANFAKAYPYYIYKIPFYKKSPLFFAIPKSKVDKIYSPRDGVRELMSIPVKDLDEHLKKIVEFVHFLMQSGLQLADFGITYSTLMGHYSPNMSDINIVIYGKEKFWSLMHFLEASRHKDLRWKTYEEWEEFYKKRNRFMIHKKEIYIKNMYRKKSEGFFKNTLFVIFAVENEDEAWFKWGAESYRTLGSAKFSGTVTDHRDSIVRPGCYILADAKFVDGEESCKDCEISKVVFYTRDLCMIAYPGEKVEVKGVVEEVTPKFGKRYYRVVIGYFDSYMSDRRDSEYLRVMEDRNGIQ